MLRKRIGYDSIRRVVCKGAQFEWYRELSAVASRIREMREIMGWTPEEMAEKTEVTPEVYLQYEAGRTDMPFTFIYKSAQAFNMELTELLEGHNAFLSTYTVTRRGKGETTAKEEGIAISNLAPKFRDKVAEPYWVRYEYSEKQQNEPIHTTTHKGQEFDLVLSGSLKVQVGDHTEILEEGDSIEGLRLPGHDPAGRGAEGGDPVRRYAQGREV